MRKLGELEVDRNKKKKGKYLEQNVRQRTKQQLTTSGVHFKLQQSG